MTITDTIYPYMVAPAVAWLLAHLGKFIVGRFKKEKKDISSYMFVSGGMPSSHSATTVSLATIVGLTNGFGSALFSIAGLFAIIVMYDAMMVRRSSGDQGIALQQLIKEQKSSVKLRRIAVGHTPLEVLVGASLGIIIGLVVFLSTL